MFKYSKDGISVLTILDTRRAKRVDSFLLKFKWYIEESKILLNWEGSVKRRLGKVIKGKKPVIGRNSIRYRE